jgi:peptide chain release factor 2
LEKSIDQLESQEQVKRIEAELREKQIQIFLSGKYDGGGAILSIYSGAGGQDAQDWASMLLRMYEMYCQRKGLKTEVLHQSFGEGVGPEGRIGTKSVVLEIKGKFAFGILKNENGVHRLVRMSPFSPKKLRHTSFALVEVIPEIPSLEKESIKVEPKDLRVEFFRASGPGGQYVNKRETAVRITHLPSKIVACCQSERSQAKNRKRAMDLLLNRLFQLKKEKHLEKVSEIKGKKQSVSWGNQIRNYVLHPYKLVKDVRTGVENSQVEDVLEGHIDEFLEAGIKLKKDKT